jgi:hypothetical protein
LGYLDLSRFPPSTTAATERSKPRRDNKFLGRFHKKKHVKVERMAIDKMKYTDRTLSANCESVYGGVPRSLQPCTTYQSPLQSTSPLLLQ